MAISKHPNFFIVGVHKCGTTALFDYIGQHPLAFCSAEKEPAYFAFDLPAVRGPKTYDDYLALFAGANDSHIAVGEASTAYFLSAVAARELFSHYPQAKLIIMIRNPVDMVYSFHSQMLVTLNENIADFETAWRMQEARRTGKYIPDTCLVPDFLQYRKIGQMSSYAKAFIDLFPAEQIRFILFDDFRSDPRKVYDETCAYLGLPVFKDVNLRIINANRAHKSWLVARIAKRPVHPAIRRIISAIKSILGIRSVSIRRAVNQLNIDRAPRKALTPEFRRELLEVFSDEVSELEKLTGRDLQNWRE